MSATKAVAGPTPGPWEVDEAINDFSVVAATGRIAGYASEANAHLIAAAPDLLKAAKFAHNVIAANGVYEPSERLAIEKLSAAIRKAEAS